MKHRISFYLTYALVVLFGSIGLLLLLLGEKEPRESKMENRMLSGFPSLSMQTVSDGSFMADLESYLSDGVPGRDRIMTGTAILMNGISLERTDISEEDVFDAIGDCSEEPDAFFENEPEPTAAPSEAPTAAPAEIHAAEQPEPTAAPSEAPRREEPESSASPVRECFFRRRYKDGTYRTTGVFPKENVENAIEVLNAYRSVLPEDGHLFFTQSPYAGVANSLPRGAFVGWDSDVEEVIAEHVLPGVEIINTVALLEEPLLNGEDLYFRTDHHWKPRAACYVVQAMLERIGIRAPDYDTYSYRHYKSFYGSAVTARPELKATLAPDTIDVLIPNLPVRGYAIAWDGTEKPSPFIKTGSGEYTAYLGGTYGPWRRFETGVDSGRKCLVIGDSFLLPFVPYLAPFYEEVHCTNFRRANYNVGRITWSVSDYIRENGISDVFIVVCTEDDINSPFMLELMRKYL